MFENNGCRVMLFENKKFKTNSISISMVSELQKETATQNALLLEVLGRGCELFSTSKEISVELEECFGANLASNVDKHGDKQVFGFSVSYPADEFVNANITKRLMTLMLNVIFKPNLREGLFVEDFFNQEKENLRQEIEGLKDDKKDYAHDRLLNCMFEGEPYSLCELGDLDTLEKLTNQDLYRHYKQLLKSVQIVVLLSGRFSNKIVEEFSVNLNDILERDIETQDLGKLALKTPREIFEKTEEFDVTQGKLEIGFTTETLPSSPDFIPLVVANAIFGGGMQSKLFTVVREQESLAYYAVSAIDKFKGVMFAYAGIDLQHKQKAQELILSQLSKVQNGEISDFEFSASKKSIINSLRALGDSLLAEQSFYFNQLLTKSKLSIEEMISEISEIKIEEVVRVAKKIKPHTVYFMTEKTGVAL